MRPSRHQMFMEFARAASRRSTCMRLNVGAVIVGDGRNVLSIGYNGVAAGEPHCSGNLCPGRHGCTLTIHAEANAVKRLSRHHDARHLACYTTDSPCDMCVDELRGAGVREVYFEKPYRVMNGLDDAIMRGLLDVFQVSPAGYVLDWRTKQLI